MNVLRKILLPILNRKNFSKKIKYYNYLEENQWNSLNENLDIQKQLLYNNVLYSINNVPYYKNLGLKESDFSKSNIYEDMKKLPFLTKDILKREYDNLYIDNKNVRRIYENTSGGSTGEPVKFMQDSYYHDWGRAIAILHDEWAGRKMGEPQIKLWGSERDILGQKKKLKHRLANWVRNLKLLNSFKMSEKDMIIYIKEINKYQPNLILGYVQSVYELAKYIKKSNMEIYSPNSIMTSAGILYPKYRELISDVFNCHVFNRYGSREVGDMACDCEKHEGLHLSIFNHYIEIIDENGERCEPGEMGQIVVTTLRNKTMPLIRYKIGDMGIMSDKKCSCGRGLPMLEKVVGRITDVFTTKNGKKVPAEYFIHFIGVVLNKGFINKFQVIQKDFNLIIIKLKLDDETMINKYKSEFEDIKDKIKLVMGEEVKVKYKIVDEIPPSKSGKYRYTISEIERK